MLTLRSWIAVGAIAVLWSVSLSVSRANDVEAPEKDRRWHNRARHEELEKSEKLQGAIDRAFVVIEAGVKNYPSNRECFSCHHQTLPLLSMSLKDRKGLHEAPKAFWEREVTKSILDFTEASFAWKQKSMREGQGVGGKALTVAYGLWAMDLAGAERNETSDAMIDYLLKTQADDGAWNFQSVRPPAASSRSMTTAIAVYGLRSYGHGYVELNRLLESYRKANEWSVQAKESESQEELNGMAWLDYMLAKEAVVSPIIGVNEPITGVSDTSRLMRRIDRILNSQNDDGGWGQTEDMPSDAYTTGQTLLILAQIVYQEKQSIQTTNAFLDGIDFLLQSQKQDGSWHVATRAKPVQVFFDNGDPHGKDQFISIMATNWAVAALANFQSSGADPLESHQVVHRKLNKSQSIENPFGS